jgi:hypothetical protein
MGWQRLRFFGVDPSVCLYSVLAVTLTCWPPLIFRDCVTWKWTNLSLVTWYFSAYTFKFKFLVVSIKNLGVPYNVPYSIEAITFWNLRNWLSWINTKREIRFLKTNRKRHPLRSSTNYLFPRRYSLPEVIIPWRSGIPLREAALDLLFEKPSHGFGCRKVVTSSNP